MRDDAGKIIAGLNSNEHDHLYAHLCSGMVRETLEGIFSTFGVEQEEAKSSSQLPRRIAVRGFDRAHVM